MDKDVALARIKGLLMIAADRSDNSDENGCAAACLLISDAIVEAGIAASDIEAVVQGSVTGRDELEGEVDDTAADIAGDEEDEAGEEAASAGSALSQIQMMVATARKTIEK